MKFTISWLNEHLDTKKSDKELIHQLTNIGLEVEDVVNASKIFSNFVVAQVKEEKKPVPVIKIIGTKYLGKRK